MLLSLSIAVVTCHGCPARSIVEQNTSNWPVIILAMSCSNSMPSAQTES